MQKYYYLLLAVMITISLGAKAQHQISGKVEDEASHNPLPGVIVQIKGTSRGAATDMNGQFSLEVPAGKVMLQFKFVGYEIQEKEVNDKTTFVKISLKAVENHLEEVIVMGYGRASRKDMRRMERKAVESEMANHESYSAISENSFRAVNSDPLSTFSIDVDRASYTNVRRFLNDGELPPADAVRVEEMINYFDYKYKNPTGKDPVAIHTDMAVCPWNSKHQLVRIALKAKEVEKDKLPPSNLVFLLDVSGSMSEPNKLPLVKKAMKALVEELRPADKVAIVVYAGAAGIVLPSTPGNNRKKIIDALEKLEAGGSTAGGAGIKLAYETAAENLLKDGNNRVIIATDGDFNVGESSQSELIKLIEKERDNGIFLSVLGFGMGIYKDDNLELLADKGNGNYAYIDNYEEARRTFVTEFGGTLFTVAKDVKLQIEFNPKYVQGYRLVGYENRLLNNEDFNNDKKDAGDMGAGHTVTALYEVIPTGNKEGVVNWVDPLKYQQSAIIGGAEVLTVKLRYKEPKANTSELISQVLPWKEQQIINMPEDFQLASAVAAFGLILRNSRFKGDASYDNVLAIAQKAKGDDPEGYRAEFVQLVKKAKMIKE